jgi:hypothetical protein
MIGFFLHIREVLDMYIHSLDAVRGRSSEPQKILFPSFTHRGAPISSAADYKT